MYESMLELQGGSRGSPMRGSPEIGLEVSWSIEGPHLVIALAGEIDAANADSLPDVVIGALSDDRSVLVDLAAVTFLDSSLLRALVQCRSRLADTGVECRVRNPTAQARRIFEITALTDLLLDESTSV